MHLSTEILFSSYPPQPLSFSFLSLTSQPLFEKCHPLLLFDEGLARETTSFLCSPVLYSVWSQTVATCTACSGHRLGLWCLPSALVMDRSSSMTSE